MTLKASIRLFALVFVMALVAQNSARASDESKLIALENAWNQAQLHHDAKALDTLVGDKFIYTDIDGSVMDKAKFLSDIKDTSYNATLIANEDARVDLYPNAAVVTGVYHTKGTDKGKPFEHYGRFTDTWIFQDDQWRCVASHTTLLRR